MTSHSEKGFADPLVRWIGEEGRPGVPTHRSSFVGWAGAVSLMPRLAQRVLGPKTPQCPSEKITFTVVSTATGSPFNK